MKVVFVVPLMALVLVDHLVMGVNDCGYLKINKKKLSTKTSFKAN